MSASALDRGLPIKERLHALHNDDEAHLLADFKCTDVHDVFVYVLDCRRLRELRSFDGFDRSDPLQSNMEAGLQWFLRTAHAAYDKVEQLVVNLQGASAQYPLDLFLETVFECDAEAAKETNASNIDSCCFRRDAILKSSNVKPVDLDKMLRVPRNLVDNALTSFMHETNDGRKVVEYRLWVMVNNAEIQFGNMLYEQLSAQWTWRGKRNASSVPERDVRFGPTSARSSSSATVGVDQRRAHRTSHIAGEYERHYLIDSKLHYLAMLQFCTGNRWYTDNESKLLSTKVPLSNCENEAHPNNVFTPEVYFRTQRAYVQAEQCVLASYRLGESTWTFPLKSCVIRVPVARHNVRDFVHLYTPDYQARIIQPRLPKDVYKRKRADGDREGNQRSPQNNLSADDSANDALCSSGRLTPDINDEVLNGESQQPKSNIAPLKEVTMVENFADHLARFDYGDRETQAREHEAHQRQAGVVGNGSALTALRARYSQKSDNDVQLSAANMSAVDAAALRTAAAYTRRQDAIFADYEAECCSSTSHISAPGMAINRWMEQMRAEGRDRSVGEIRPHHTEESFFGAMMTNEFLEYRQLSAVLGAQKELFFVKLAHRDTYRHQYALHLNIVLVGVPAVSKSLALDIREGGAIPDSTHCRRGETAASRNVDCDRDDEFHMRHEIPTHHMRANLDPEKNKEFNQKKDVMTSCRTEFDVFALMPDGSRTFRTCHSSQIGNFVGATNERKKSWAPEFLSRVVALLMVRQQLPVSISTLDMQYRNALRIDASLRQAIADSVHDDRIEQFDCYHIEKLIFVNALTEPTLAVLQTYYPSIERTLKVIFGAQEDPRRLYQLSMVVRQLTIMHAARRLRRCRRSPAFGKPTLVQHLKYVDAYLYDNQEIVFWAIELFSDQLVDPHLMAVIRALRIYVAGLVQSQIGGDVMKLFLSATVSNVFSSTLMTMTTFDRPDNNCLVSQQQQQQHQQQQQQQQHHHHHQSMSNSDRYDWNYVRLPNVRELSTALAHLMTKRVELFSRCMSETEILETLDALSKRFWSSKDFKLKWLLSATSGASSSPPQVDFKQPPLPLELDLSSTVQERAGVKITSQHTFISTAMLMAIDDDDPATVIIRQLRDKHTTPTSYVSAHPYRRDAPHLLNVYKVEREPLRKHKFVSLVSLTAEQRRLLNSGGEASKQASLAAPAAASPAPTPYYPSPPWETEPCFDIDRPIDEYSVQMRLRAIGLPWNNERLIQRFSVQPDDALWRSKTGTPKFSADEFLKEAYRAFGGSIVNAVASKLLTVTNNTDNIGACDDEDRERAEMAAKRRRLTDEAVATKNKEIDTASAAFLADENATSATTSLTMGVDEELSLGTPVDDDLPLVSAASLVISNVTTMDEDAAPPVSQPIGDETDDDFFHDFVI
jgi:hypothetical protein